MDRYQLTVDRIYGTGLVQLMGDLKMEKQKMTEEQSRQIWGSNRFPTTPAAVTDKKQYICI